MKPEPRRGGEVGIVGGGEEIGADAALRSGLRAQGRPLAWILDWPRLLGAAPPRGRDGRESAGGGVNHAVRRSERTDRADRRQSRVAGWPGDRRSVRGRLGGGEAAGRLVGERRDNRAALLEPRLTRQQLMQLALERALIEQLPPATRSRSARASAMRSS